MRYRHMLAAAAAVALGAGHAPAQSIAQLVSGAGDGLIQLRFASRPGVCGDGRGMIAGGDHMMLGDGGWSDGSGGWRRRCQPGPVRVVLKKTNGAIERVSSFIGGNDSSADVHDLGTVSAPEAATYLLGLARDAAHTVGNGAVVGAILADSAAPWPALAEVARDAHSHETRQDAAFWLGQAAAARIRGTTLFGDRVDETPSNDEEVRGEAIFALSQQPRDESVPALISVARTNRDPMLRGKALFWLGQSGDPRAIDLFSQILAGAQR